MWTNNTGCKERRAILKQGDQWLSESMAAIPSAQNGYTLPRSVLASLTLKGVQAE